MRKSLLALPLVLFSACASVDVASTHKTYPAREANCALDVLSKPPERPYEKVAALRITGDSTESAAYLANVKEEACRLGGDAVIMGRIAVDTRHIYFGVRTGYGAATVIKYLAPAAKTEKPPEAFPPPPAK